MADERATVKKKKVVGDVESAKSVESVEPTAPEKAAQEEAERAGPVEFSPPETEEGEREFFDRMGFARQVNASEFNNGANGASGEQRAKILESTFTPTGNFEEVSPGTVAKLNRILGSIFPNRAEGIECNCSVCQERRVSEGKPRFVGPMAERMDADGGEDEGEDMGDIGARIAAIGERIKEDAKAREESVIEIKKHVTDFASRLQAQHDVKVKRAENILGISKMVILSGIIGALIVNMLEHGAFAGIAYFLASVALPIGIILFFLANASLALVGKACGELHDSLMNMVNEDSDEDEE